MQNFWNFAIHPVGVTWNIYAWLAWGVLLVGIRLATELRRQSIAQADEELAIGTALQAWE